MSDQDELFDDDLIDRIANASRPNCGPTFYRELRHCRSLPKTMKCYESAGDAVLSRAHGEAAGANGHGTGTVGADRSQVRKTLQKMSTSS